MPSRVEVLAVRYPGREERISEPPARSVDELVDPVIRGCEGFLNTPLLLFGHSMGATIAYEVALGLQQLHAEQVVTAVLVSGRSAPGLERDRGLASASDGELMARVEALGGTDMSAFEHPELRDLALSSLRADYRILEHYTRRERPVTKLRAPVVAYYGTDDAELDGDTVNLWSQTTMSSFAVRPFSGGHFYLTEHARTVVEDFVTRFGLQA